MMYKAGPILPVSGTAQDESFFPVRITSALIANQYTFVEVWTTPGGVIADKVGGRFNSYADPAYAIDGSTFSVTAAGSPVQVLARRAPGMCGVGWELKGFGTTPTYSTNFGIASGEVSVATANACWANLGGISGIGPYAVMFTIGASSTAPKYYVSVHGCVLNTAYPSCTLRLSFSQTSVAGVVPGGNMVYMVRQTHTLGNNESFAMSGLVYFPSLSVDSYVGVCVEDITTGASALGAVFVSQYTLQAATGTIS